MALLLRRRTLVVRGVLLASASWLVVLLVLSVADRLEEQRHQHHRRPEEGTVGRKPRQSPPEEGGGESSRPPDDPHGPGEMGRPVKLANLSQAERRQADRGWELNAFNQYASDLVSLHRSLPEVRDPGCLKEKYEVESLPATSVIICFHNEAWSVLLRTVHSVLDRSPEHLLHEIILVDDFSDMPHLGRQLDEYIASRLSPKVRVLRARRREGLIRARLLGAAAATGPVLTYLDSHCECANGWLEPLLARIRGDRSRVVCPVIDVIDDDTFQFHHRDSEGINVGGFDWNLQFNWHAMPEREAKGRLHPWDPVRSPTMAGGLFSIDREFFERLGTYDSGFDIWGGENLELSFKTWMCGGSLEIVPCSHVGHVFRKRSPYRWRTGVNVLRRNSVRLAEVWLDNYKTYYYQRIGNDLGEFGDVAPRRELRRRLRCRSFEWYLKNVYPELFVPGEALASGEVRNLGAGGDTCLDSPARRDDLHKPVGLWPCHGQGGNQYWMLSREGEIRRDESCLDYAGKDVVLYPCHGSKGNQLWTYDSEAHSIRHGSSRKCLEMSLDKQRLLMRECSSAAERQKWTFQNYHPPSEHS